MSVSNYFKVMFGMAAFWVAISFSSVYAREGSMLISIAHFVGNQQLQLDTVQYKNELNQPYTITKCKYYIGKIKLKKSTGGYYTLNDYYLVSEEEPASKQIVLKDVPKGEYTGMEFIIGVDSIDNCSGAQSGALDPVNAMFWTWNTGYIFLKMEGVSPVSKSPGNVFEYHIGGYKQPTNCIRTIALNFGSSIEIGDGKLPHITLKADLEEVLENPHTIDFSKLSSVTDFHNATLIADNYGNLFSILGVVP